MFLIVDKRTTNIMGEHDTYAEAKAHYISLVAAHPPVAPDLIILGNQGEVKPAPSKAVERAGSGDESATYSLAAG
jgi:hypothetical protein